MEEHVDIHADAYDPASMSASSLGTVPVVWYRRPWFLITVGVVVVLAISVITDLPNRITPTQDAQAQNATIKQVNTDIAPCTFAVNEAFSFYRKDVAGTLTASNRAQIPALLTGDQTACSFASSSIYDLTNNIQPLETKAGREIDKLLASIVTWTTNDALACIEDIQYLFKHPGDQKKLANITLEEGYLSKDRTAIFTDLAQADAIIGINLNTPKLPVLQNLPGT